MPRDCPVCGTPQGPASVVGPLKKTFPYALRRECYDFCHCAACDLYYIDPIIPAEDFQEIYFNWPQFAPFPGEEWAYSPARIRGSVEYLQSRFRDLVMSRQDYDWKVLEVGAGMATLARALKELPVRVKAIAQDITPEAAAICPWVDRYVVGDVSAAELDDEAPYDFISMTHVLEHAIEPVGMLRRCRQLLRPEGRIFVSAPHRPANWRSDGGIAAWENYPYQHTPAHLQFFSETSLACACSRAALRLTFWNGAVEEGQVFEAWLEPAP